MHEENYKKMTYGVVSRAITFLLKASDVPVDFLRVGHATTNSRELMVSIRLLSLDFKDTIF